MTLAIIGGVLIVLSVLFALFNMGSTFLTDPSRGFKQHLAAMAGVFLGTVLVVIDLICFAMKVLA